MRMMSYQIENINKHKNYNEQNKNSGDEMYNNG